MVKQKQKSDEKHDIVSNLSIGPNKLKFIEFPKILENYQQLSECSQLMNIDSTSKKSSNVQIGRPGSSSALALVLVRCTAVATETCQAAAQPAPEATSERWLACRQAAGWFQVGCWLGLVRSVPSLRPGRSFRSVPVHSGRSFRAVCSRKLYVSG